MNLTKTPQQEAITSHCETSNESLNVVARAGSGKTTSLLMICDVLEGSAFLGAFNKGIATELQARLKNIENSLIEAGTFHSLGFRGWRRAYPKVQMNGDKLWKIIDTLPKEDTQYIGGPVRELVSLAKQTLFKGDEDDEKWQDLIDHYGVETIQRGERVIATVKKVFKLSVEECSKVIDFDDMLFAPLHFGTELPQYDTMLCDEAQDLSHARQELAIGCLSPGGRMICVGDEKQSIYGFSGAGIDSMNIMQKKLNSHSLPLTVSWRCAKEIIKRAQTWVPDIEWAPKANQGEVFTVPEEMVMRGLVNGRMSGGSVPQPRDAVLCRNTRPLVQMAYHCIRHRVGVTIEGRDIGKRLIKLVERLEGNTKTLGTFITNIEKFEIEEIERLKAGNKMGAAANMSDMCGTVRFLAVSLRKEGKTHTRDLTTLLESMFSDAGSGPSNNILLSTIHKSKGREWGKVFILGEDRYQPSVYATQKWMIQQELNLMYVATTRAKDTLVHIEVENTFKKD